MATVLPTSSRSELREPRLETALEGDGGDDGDEDRRQHRDEAEQRDDPDMQPGRCGSGPPLAHQAARLPGDDDDQEEDEGGIDRKEADDDLVRRQDRRQAGKDEERRQRRGEGRQHGDRPDDGEQPRRALGKRCPRR